jgi:hypothetical protein
MSPLTVSGAKECPMCGGMMRLKRSEQSVPMADQPQPSRKISAEWICPECDYFEEADEDRG